MDKALKSVLDWWDAAGVDIPDVKLNAPKRTPKPRSAPTQKTAPQVPRPKPAAPKPTVDAAPIAAKAKTLAELKAAMDNFDAGPLSDSARQCVFARGNPDADVMVIGEAPGREEDIAGKAFIGPEGQLLDKMLASIGLTEETAYLTNAVYWRIPKDKNPSPENIALCLPFLRRHIELAAPKVILLMGQSALAAMTNLSSVMKNRGQWQMVTIAGQDIPALPIYHPSLLLRQPTLKKDAWRDLLALKERLASM